MNDLTPPVLPFERSLIEDDGFVTVTGMTTPQSNRVPDYVSIAEEIHLIDNAKWWQDLDTGASILETRNRGDLLMLVVTELSEASDGASGLMDDKLPHLPMFDCELADTAIRTFDLVGSEIAMGRLPRDIATTLFEAISDEPEPGLRLLCANAQLMLIVNMVSVAKEAERKQRWRDFHVALGDIISGLFVLARFHQIDLWDVIQQKRAFNSSRVDHSIEARRAADGKKS